MASPRRPAAHARGDTERSLAALLVSQARRRSRLSQREVARRAGVSRTTIVEIEAGTRDPGVATLRAVLRGAGLDLDARLVPRDDHDETLAITMGGLTSRQQRQQRRNLDRFVDGLAAGLEVARPLRRVRERHPV